MARLPLSDFQREESYIAAQVREHYRRIPPGLGWVIAPLLCAIAAILTFDNLTFRVSALISFAAAVVGLIIGRLFALRVPAWDDARREKLMATAGAQFHSRYDAYIVEFGHLVTDVEQFRRAVESKSYRLYVPLANAVGQRRGVVKTDSEFFFDSMPSAISELCESMEELIRQVESDPVSVTAYEPNLRERVEFIRQRVEAKNVPDFDRAWQEIEPIFARLEQRTAPFNLVKRVGELKGQAQNYRDNILSDPQRAAFWRELQDKDEARRHNKAVEEATEVLNEEMRRHNEAREDETRRHNEAIEKETEDQSETARRQVAADEERNEILRERPDAAG